MENSICDKKYTAYLSSLEIATGQKMLMIFTADQGSL